MFFAKFNIYFDTVRQLFCCLLLFSDISSLKRVFPKYFEKADLISMRVDYPYMEIDVFREVQQLFGHCSEIFFLSILILRLPMSKMDNFRKL